MIRQIAILLPLIALLAVSPAAAQQQAATDMITNGDVNGDGYFDIFDIMRLERTVTLGMGAKDEELSAGDVDGNGRLDQFDLLVLNEALTRFNQGTPMYEAVKGAIESDLSLTKDNVEIYLDLAKFYKKEQNFQLSRNVLESILEALETDHPLYNKVLGQLDEVKQEQTREMEEAEDFLGQDVYQAADNMAGKTSLRSQVLKLKGRLNKLMDDQQLSAHYNSKRVKGQLGDLMDDMLRKVNQDQMVDASTFDSFNSQVRGVLENPDNIVKQLDSQQRSRIRDLVDTSTKSMREEAVKIKQDFQRSAEANLGRQGPRTGGETILNRNENRLEQNMHGENMDAQGRVPANAPTLEPDTISIVAPQYKLSWDVSNILGAKNAALEISKANAKFSNPRGTGPDEEATLFYTPNLGTVRGERRGSALELEGVGTYQYRVAALNARGEPLSRFSDATQLVVVYNNLDISANTPEVDPKVISPEKPDYTFRWDVSNIEGARDAAVEISKPDIPFGNVNGRARDRLNSFFFNPSLGRTSGMFSSSISGLSEPGTYYFRVIAVSANGDFMGQWSNTATLMVAPAGTGVPAVPVPVPARGDSAPKPMGTPSRPTARQSGDGYIIDWDVSNISGATGANFEMARLRSGTDATLNEVDEVIISDTEDSTSGQKEIDGGLLDRAGRYQARVSALDSAGNLLTNWSEPAMMTVVQEQLLARRAAQTPKPQQPAPAAEQPVNRPAPAASRDSVPVDSAAMAAAATNGKEQPPAGKTLEINQKTPLYEEDKPSSRELATLEKGERLIHISTKGLWERVYYPKGAQRGWVLSFYVDSLNQ